MMVDWLLYKGGSMLLKLLGVVTNPWAGDSQSLLQELDQENKDLQSQLLKTGQLAAGNKRLCSFIHSKSQKKTKKVFLFWAKGWQWTYGFFFDAALPVLIAFFVTMEPKHGRVFQPAVQSFFQLPKYPLIWAHLGEIDLIVYQPRSWVAHGFR